jgi:hypothetical protein
LALSTALTLPAVAHGPRQHAPGDIDSPRNAAVTADYDIMHAAIRIERDAAVFHMHVAGRAGATRPVATGQFPGAAVHAYVWPTSLDSATVGFEPGQGVLSLVVTFHPDFDDGAPGRVANRDVWHSHWVVLTPDDACGPGALKVRDIEAGRQPRLPADWPGVPLLISSPNLPPALAGDTIEVRVPLTDIPGIADARFDGVTAGLRVNANLHAPLLCVVNVFDVASGNLSLPGRPARAAAAAPNSPTRR